ncbi:hydroxyacid dehydrogenase [Kocuria coralli]|uniref:Hydroxyacid dehydrogenase n=1 Tax=Kocuria coralli TaxID=1461025 RepID=A0A5J5KX02_9MICC|nr:hydroxyacid dehydrogenase [Kocuria coralli]KAA9394297.1 hydroxyacid dehydrogenase [Kocuria coralli]
MTERPLVVGLGPVPAEIVCPVLGDDVDFAPEPTAEELTRADGAIVRAAAPVGAGELAAMPALKVIARTGVGYNLVDVDAAAARGIPVAITPGSNTNAVAEGVFAHLLHLTKRLGPLTRLVREGRWDERGEVVVGDLEEATLGIVGYGRIGRRVHRIAEAFGMRVVAYDPVAEIPDGIRAASLEGLLESSDAVTLHLPLLPETRGLIGEAELGRMRPSSILLNLSRGGLLDEDAVLAALETGRLAGVGLDAFEPEPPADHPLYHHPSVVLSPHLMGLSTRAAEATFVDAAQAVRDVLDGGSPRFVVRA